MTDFGQTDFGQFWCFSVLAKCSGVVVVVVGFGVGKRMAYFGQFLLWPVLLWPILLWPVLLWPILLWPTFLVLSVLSRSSSSFLLLLLVLLLPSLVCSSKP